MSTKIEESDLSSFLDELSLDIDYIRCQLLALSAYAKRDEVSRDVKLIRGTFESSASCLQSVSGDLKAARRYIDSLAENADP